MGELQASNHLGLGSVEYLVKGGGSYNFRHVLPWVFICVAPLTYKLREARLVLLWLLIGPSRFLFDRLLLYP